MNRTETTVIWLLRLGGGVMLTALGAVIMPCDWMSVIHRQAGLGQLPQASSTSTGFVRAVTPNLA